MTNEQKQILQAQVARIREIHALAQREQQVFDQMLFLVDARLADPTTGVAFDIETCSIIEPPKQDES